MAYICNPSYLEGEDRRTIAGCQPGQKVNKTLSQHGGSHL
jgi:hypothetical protein